MKIQTFKKYAFVGLGSNLASTIGAPKDNVLEAIERLGKLSNEPLLVSSLLGSKPLDCPPGSPDFVNGVVALLPKPNETPLSFLYELQGIEKSMGRQRSGLKNEARIIDLDLLLFKNEGISTQDLMLPHPKILKRDFVLEPLKELIKGSEFEDLISFIKKTPPKRRS
ncbi:MAG: 2-amino-4-hydroxy-6-hydroxymethyldihydropteridine diphosphokinase [Gammaproteobacteria bacterium]|jgi:2-amino-4-hydroxy-6-hydroxymethyldihydropteridine diphosphokinase|nr:2-amino-4-hydroxy-6-hydroxymethyldihydropteridine diphosphokinase [Gammaproteobacteria bacterium]